MRLTRCAPLVLLLLCSASLSLPWQSSWPNLYRMTDDGYPDGSCTVYGKATSSSSKGKSNRMKNRYKFPEDGLAHHITWDELMALPTPDATSADKALPKAVKLEDAKRYVEFSGFVVMAKSSTGGESCNCDAHATRLCDTHIELIRDPDDDSDLTKQKVIVETTSRIRKLVDLGLITGVNMEDPSDWRTTNLKQMINHWVRVKGWLFYDSDHFLQDWQTDPDDSRYRTGGKRKPTAEPDNWRATCWELHPVMSIEILASKPDDL